MSRRAAAATFLACALLAGCAAAPRDPTDAPQARFAPAGYAPPSSHAAALASWRSAEDVNAFIGARFEPSSQPRFVMVEFEPVSQGGNTLRLHWLASFHRDGAASTLQ
jgi:hypothetical protein